MNHRSARASATTRKSPSTAPSKASSKAARRQLLTMATGTGKTAVAFQICWKLWNARWNRTGEHRRPRILYLADRNILVDQPKDGIFAPFGDARCKIEGGEAIKSREMYFAIYQALASDERRPGLYREFPRTSSTSSSWTNATAAAPGTTPTGGRSSTTSSRPFSSA